MTGDVSPGPERAFHFFRQYYDTVRAVEITWQRWVTMPEGVKYQFVGAWGASHYRLMLEGPVGRAWFLAVHKVTPLPTGLMATKAGPSAPLPAIERERQAPTRGRGRRREPIMHDDNETSEIEEAGDQHDESSESRDDDTDSDSTSGDDVEPNSNAEDDDDSSSSSALGSDGGADRDSSA
ncbi:pheromone-processing carboxypeptidase KEX1-like [Camellia sinensis]|uniref:pheromone-processing carboxypeptidase KEX1-like n=1 Tax=Camellia sinensis TaxID=4442 RepID=UPI001036D3E1|nr:pheromone-processing carboxypeptidase KEX1-like [Camellia sinensis]